MSREVGSIHYRLGLETRDFNRKADMVSRKMGDVGKKMSLAFTVPVAAMAVKSVKAASDLNETINKVEVAFGNNADQIKEWSETTIDNIGLAGSSAMEAAALFGDMGTSMGLSTAEAADMSMELTNLAGDLASFKNINIAEAQTALSAVFTGETESLKRLGIVMTQTNLEMFAMEQGLNKSIKEMTEAEKVQVRYAYVMAKTTNAQGDFARTADGTANQIRITGERFKELQEDIGQKLIPIANKFLAQLQKMIGWFTDLSPATQDWIIKIAGLLAVLGPLLIITSKLITAIKVMRTTYIAAGIAMKAFGAKAAASNTILGTTASKTLPLLKAGLTALPWVAVGAVAVAAGVQIYNKWRETSQLVGEVQKKIEAGNRTIKQTHNRMIRLYEAGKTTAQHLAAYEEKFGKYGKRTMGTSTLSDGSTVTTGTFASGGTHMGGWAKVGETGPELVRLPKGSEIMNATESQGAAGGVNIYGNINIADKGTADYFLRRLNRDQELNNLGLAAS